MNTLISTRKIIYFAKRIFVMILMCMFMMGGTSALAQTNLHSTEIEKSEPSADDLSSISTPELKQLLKIGESFMRQKDYKNAQPYFEQAMAFAEKNDIPAAETNYAFDRLLSCYDFQAKYDEEGALFARLIKTQKIQNLSAEERNFFWTGYMVVAIDEMLHKQHYEALEIFLQDTYDNIQSLKSTELKSAPDIDSLTIQKWDDIERGYLQVLGEIVRHYDPQNPIEATFKEKILGKMISIMDALHADSFNYHGTWQLLSEIKTEQKKYEEAEALLYKIIGEDGVWHKDGSFEVKSNFMDREVGDLAQLYETTGDMAKAEQLWLSLVNQTQSIPKSDFSRDTLRLYALHNLKTFYQNRAQTDKMLAVEKQMVKIKEYKSFYSSEGSPSECRLRQYCVMFSRDFIVGF